MRILPFAAIVLAFATQAASQVTTSDQAIDSLKPTPGASHTAPARKTARRTTYAPTQPHALSPSLARAAPQVPAAPPANPVIAPPPIVLPAHPPPPPPAVPVKPHAQGTATRLPNGARITFGAGQSDLNPDTQAAIRAIATDALANPAAIIAVTAWAPGTLDDPSTPRRLSLDRALAARAVLINAGIPSARIRAIAKGMNDIGSDPPDRADVVEIVPPPVKP